MPTTKGRTEVKKLTQERNSEYRKEIKFNSKDRKQSKNPKRKKQCLKTQAKYQGKSTVLKRKSKTNRKTEVENRCQETKFKMPKPRTRSYKASVKRP